MPAVSGLDAEFPEKVVARNVDATTDESRKVVQELGFKNHGLVIRSADGTAVWRQADHDVAIGDVRAELRRLIRESPGERP
ncbi:MAG: hypothetical protein M3547_04830 [Acidobacteriota bacterium]|nr:hypothetical protein [Acidobacteriota bacterium]